MVKIEAAKFLLEGDGIDFCIFAYVSKPALFLSNSKNFSCEGTKGLKREQ